MSTDITPPPNQPLHLVLWRGLEPGYYFLLGAALLGGFFFVLFDVSWWRIAVALLLFVLLVIAVLPYRGMRLWQWGWLRLGHGGAVLLAYTQPARRQQLAQLAARFSEAAPRAELPGAAAGPADMPRPAPSTMPPGGDTSSWNPAWTAAWHASAAVPVQRSTQIAGDEGDGMLPRAGTPPADPFPAVSAAASGRQWTWSTLTLGQIRAWGQETGPARRAE